jgi:hypothetical protein
MVIFDKNDKKQIKVDITKALKFFKIHKLKNPKETIEEIIKSKMFGNKNRHSAENS